MVINLYFTRPMLSGPRDTGLVIIPKEGVTIHQVEKCVKRAAKAIDSHALTDNGNLPDLKKTLSKKLRGKARVERTDSIILRVSY